MRHLTLGLMALIATVLLLLAACGGDDDASNDDSGADEPTPAELTDAPDDGDDDDTDEPTDAPDDGDDGDDDGAAAEGHACDLITAAEVSAAVGVEMGEGRDYLATTADATNCEWQSSDGAVTVYAEVLRDGGRGYFDAVHIADDDPAFEEQPVEGLGDEAIFSDLGVLDVVDGDTFISVQIVVFFSDVDELTAARALAEAILEKL